MKRLMEALIHHFKLYNEGFHVLVNQRNGVFDRWSQISNFQVGLATNAKGPLDESG
jgi:hypothetical protein